MRTEPPATGPLRARIAEIVGAHHITVNGRAADHPRDWWPLALKDHSRVPAGTPPTLVAAPADASEVAAVLETCAESGMSVTPFGAGSGVVGAAIPSDGGMLLDLSRLQRVRQIDRVNQLVTAEAGVIGGRLETQLRGEGLTLGLYPQSFDLATVGGWVATRATGTYSGRYGGIEDRIAGLQVALADGTLVETPSMPRWAVGPDLRQLLVGSEGTLGVVTAVTLRLSRWPQRRLLRACRFAAIGDGLDALRAIAQGGLRPAVMRLYDEAESAQHRAVTANLGDGCLLLLAFDGPARLTELEEELTLALCADRGAVDLGREPAERWEANRLIVPDGFHALRDRGVMADFIDVQAPWDRIEATYRAVRDGLLTHCTSVMAHFSHIYEQGSSCYFVIRIEASDDDEAVARYLDAWAAAMTAVLSNGGAVAHHHGVGLARAPWVTAALGDAWPLWDRLKQAFDPLGILNPGKLGHAAVAASEVGG